MDSVVHFELPFDDRDRMAGFYESVFDWQMQKLGDEMGNYVLVTTVKTDEQGQKRVGAIDGGLYPRQSGQPGQSPSLVIEVDDLAASMERVRTAGGEILGEPMPIYGVGDYVSFIDPEGNRMSMLQPLSRTRQAQSFQ